MDLSELRKLRERIPHGGIRKVATRAGVTAQTVSQQLRGISHLTDAVFNACMEVIREEQERSEKLKKEFSNIDK